MSELINHEKTLVLTDQVTMPDTVTFRLSSNVEVLVLRTDGFYYRGQLVEDAGEAHRLFMDFFKQARKDMKP